MKERSRSRWSFASWRPRSRKKSREAREAALANKSSSDDIQVSYSSENATPDVKGTMTPPVERKSKKSTIPRFFKPWKWKRKKKSEPGKEPIQAYGNEGPDACIEPLPATQEGPTPADADATETSPEATVSFDPSAGQGIIPTSAEMSEQPTGVSAEVTQVEINSTAPGLPPVPSEPVPSLVTPATPTSPDEVAPPLPEKTGRVSPAVPPKSRSPAVPPKLGLRIGTVPGAGSPANHTGRGVGFGRQDAGQQAPRGVGFGSQIKNIPDAEDEVPEPGAAVGQWNGDVNHEEDSDEDSLSDYDNKENAREDSDSDDDCNTSLLAKVKRNDSLAFHLRNRPTREALQERNILPQKSNDEKKQMMNAIGSKLVRRLSQRPTQEELEQRNIYKASNQTDKDAMEEKKRNLVRKLSFRPTVEELRQRNIIKFNEYVEVMEAFDYDRKAEKPWTKLTPQDKASIRKELNDFKSVEMDVHEESRKYTRFHRP